MSTMLALLLPAVGYLFGSIPFGVLIGRLVRVDVRQSGSKNIGATNVSRVIGRKWGVLTLLCDCLKGFLPICFAVWVLPEEMKDKELLVVLTGIMTVLGHMFSVFLKFTGGKGVATGLGVFLYLSPPAIGISLVVFVVAVAVSGFVSVGSLLASGLIPLWLYLLGSSRMTIFTGVMVATLIWLKHDENISRLLKGTEKSWRKNTSENISEVVERRQRTGDRRRSEVDRRKSVSDRRQK